MHHKQCSFLGKLSLRWNTVIAACLNCASGTNSSHTILQEAFSDSQGGNPPAPYLAGAEVCLPQHNQAHPICLWRGSLLHYLLPCLLPSSITSSLVSRSSVLPLSDPSPKTRVSLAENHAIFLLKTQQGLPVVLWVKPQLFVWFIFR